MAQAPLSEEAVVRFLGGLWQLNRRIKHDVTPILARWQLDIRHFLILITVRKGVTYPKALSEHLQIPATLLSRYLDQLVKQGLLERQIDPHDSRRTQLHLTAQAANALREASAEIRGYASGLLQNMEPDQLFAVLAALEALGHDETKSQEPA